GWIDADEQRSGPGVAVEQEDRRGRAGRPCRGEREQHGDRNEPDLIPHPSSPRLSSRTLRGSRRFTGDPPSSAGYAAEQKPLYGGARGVPRCPARKTLKRGQWTRYLLDSVSNVERSACS